MKNNQPLVSMVIPSYNHAQYVHESIQSVIDQDYENIELIIIDDGSKDDSVAKIKELVQACEARFKRFEFRYRPNKGLSTTLNEALDWCEGEYFAPVASDDIALTHKISTQVKAINSNPAKCVGVFTGVQAINEDYKILYTFGRDGAVYFKNVLLRDVPLPGQSVLLKAKELKSCNGYNKEERIEDFGLFLKLTKQGCFFASIAEPLLSYRSHESNTSKNYEFMLSAILDILENYKDEKLYKKAVSRSYLIEAGVASNFDTKRALKWLFVAIKNDVSVLLNPKWVKLFVKCVSPASFYEAIKNLYRNLK